MIVENVTSIAKRGYFNNSSSSRHSFTSKNGAIFEKFPELPTDSYYDEKMLLIKAENLRFLCLSILKYFFQINHILLFQAKT